LDSDKSGQVSKFRFVRTFADNLPPERMVELLKWANPVFKDLKRAIKAEGPGWLQ